MVFNPVMISLRDTGIILSSDNIIKSRTFGGYVRHPGHETIDNFSEKTDISIQGTGRVPEGYAAIEMVTRDYNKSKSYAIYNVVRDANNIYPNDRYNLYGS